MKEFHRNIIFTRTPMKGCYRFKDEFQLYPADFQNSPKSQHAKHFPIVLEFWTDDSENQIIPPSSTFYEFREFLKTSTNTNMQNKLNRIINLLTALSNHRFFQYANFEGHWTFVLPNGEITEELNSQFSQWGIQWFNYPGMNKEFKIENFITLHNETIKPKPHTSYYLHEPLEKYNGEIFFPDSLDFALETYFEFNEKKRKIVDSVAHLICNGIDMTQKMKSMSFLSFVSSIETLVNHENTEKNKEIKFECHECQTINSSPYSCNKCGRPIWGIAFKFREFLKTFVSTSENSIKKYKRIYNLRSKIVHDGALLLGDNQIDWENQEKSKEQTLVYLETMQLSRLALMRWLIMKNSNFEISPSVFS